MPQSRCFRYLVASVLLLACTASATVSASAQQPLLIEGKSTLYQRVLTRPNAGLLTTPDAESPQETFPPFEVFYVYDRRPAGEETMIQVGRSLEAGPEGWMVETATIPWKQAIVLGFNNPANRERALVFKTKDALTETLGQEDVTARLERLRQEAEADELPADSPIVSIEPAEYVDIENEFYILPILDSDQIRLPNRMPAKLLQIASVPQRTDGTDTSGMSREEALRNFKVGVTFVIDTTRSMKPYIDEVRAAMSQFRDRIAGSPEGDRFRFGLVGFRDNNEYAPELGYVTKVFLPLAESSDADAFVAAIENVDAATVNSDGYNEDSIAGIAAAADEMDWTPFGGRFVVLVTDAGPRAPGEGTLMGALAPAELQSQLERDGIALFTMHLLGEAGSFDHVYAEQAYRQLARFDGRDLYLPIQGASQAAFREQVDRLAGKLGDVVEDAIQGRMAESGAEGGGIEETASAIGRAMQLAYLGQVNDAQAPDVFEGWLTDRDPLDRRAFPVKPYILMSKNELSTLRDVVNEAINLGNSASQDGTSADFFNRLREVVGLITRRPEAVQDAGTIGDLLGEYLEDLPYNSEIVNITPADWRDMSPIRERQLLDGLRSKVVALERLHNDTGRWTPIKPGAPEGEYVTIVPLTLMP